MSPLHVLVSRITGGWAGVLLLTAIRRLHAHPVLVAALLRVAGRGVVAALVVASLLPIALSVASHKGSSTCLPDDVHKLQAPFAADQVGKSQTQDDVLASAQLLFCLV